MNYELKGKARWIYKFQILCKQRFLIFCITLALSSLFAIAFLLIIVLSRSHFYYVLPWIILPICMVYPHAINKRRLEQLYVDLPKEIKPEYQEFVIRYAGQLLLIQFSFPRVFKLDRDRIIELVQNYKEKEQ